MDAQRATTREPLGPGGWPRAGWRLVALLAAGVAAAVASAFALHGFTSPGLSLAARNAARASFLLFWLAFTASALAHLVPGPLTRALRARRRYFGVVFALAHFTFLGLNIAQVFAAHDGDFLALRPLWGTWIPGGLLYLAIAAMVIT